MALPRSVCVGLPVTPIRWFAIVPEFPAVSTQAVQKSTPVVSLFPVAACAIRKIVVWNGPVTPLVTLVKWPSIVVFVTTSPFASVNVVVTRVVGSVTSVKTDGTGGSPVASAASASANPAASVPRSSTRPSSSLSPFRRDSLRARNRREPRTQAPHRESPGPSGDNTNALTAGHGAAAYTKASRHRLRPVGNLCVRHHGAVRADEHARAGGQLRGHASTAQSSARSRNAPSRHTSSASLRGLATRGYIWTC